MGRHYHGRLDIPDSVNAYLPSTFGKSFCLCQTKRIIENMSVTHCVIGSYDIHVDNLLSIRCGLYGFSLMFRDGYVIRCHLCDYKSPLYVRLEGTIDPAFERFAIKAMREYECKKTNSYYSENAFRDGYSKKRIPFDIFLCLLENYYTLWDDVILHYEVNDDQAITLTLLNPYGRQNLIRITPEGTFVTEDKTMINNFSLYLLNNMLEIVDLPQHNSKP